MPDERHRMLRETVREMINDGKDRPPQPKERSHVHLKTGVMVNVLSDNPGDLLTRLSDLLTQHQS